jgi:hypothetical protein
LADGKSIPIVSDVPEEIHPIGRIRVVVGKGDLPRQRLVTRLKPVDSAKPETSSVTDGGVTPAQYGQYNDQRYAGQAQGNQTRQGGQPPANVPAGADTAGNTQWNSGGAGAEITPTGAAPPSSQQPVANQPQAGSTWNGSPSAQNLGPIAARPLERVTQGLQQAAQPLRDGLDQVDDRLKSAGEKLGSRTRELVDDLTKPFGGQQSPALSQDPRVTGNGSSVNDGAVQQWNNDATASTNPLRPGASDSSSSRDQAPTSAAPRYPLQAASGSQGTNTEWNDSSPQTGLANNQGGVTAPPLAAPKDDPWAAAADPRPHASSTQPNDSSRDYTGLASRPNAPYGGAGASSPNFPTVNTPFPQLGSAANGSSNSNQQAADASAGLASQTPTQKEDRSIFKGMLSDPAGKPLEGTEGPSQAVTMGSTIPASPVSTINGPSDSLASAKWPAPNQLANAKQPSASPVANSAPAKSGDNAALVLAAWVLLTGSVAGNLYLFWSYLDVRQKYRLMVRKSARAVGRYSAT